MAEEVTGLISNFGLETKEDIIGLLTLSMKQLGVLDDFHNNTRKPTKAGRKLTPMETRKSVWKFWHDESSYITASKIKID